MEETQSVLELSELLHEVSDVAALRISHTQKIHKAANLVGRANAILIEACTNNDCLDAVTVDADVVQGAAAIIGHEIDNLKSDLNEYNADELAGAIMNKVNSRSEQNWLTMFDFSMLGQGFVPISASMFQTFNPDEKPPAKERQKRQKTKDMEVLLTCPENIEKSEQMEETSAVLKKIENILQTAFINNNKEPMNYFKVVLDPDDFGRTVDNIFQISFLVRDNIVAMFYEDKHLWIRLLSRREQDKRKEMEPKQFITQLDMKQWAGLVKKYKIKKPFIDIADRYAGASR